MKRALMLSLLTVLMAGCTSAPYAYRDGGDYYYRNHSYYRGDGYSYHGYGPSSGFGYQDREHGS